jgi:hypothetical protein
MGTEWRTGEDANEEGRMEGRKRGDVGWAMRLVCECRDRFEMERRRGIESDADGMIGIGMLRCGRGGTE